MSASCLRPPPQAGSVTDERFVIASGYRWAGNVRIERQHLHIPRSFLSGTETNFFFAFDLHDRAFMDCDFDRAILQICERLLDGGEYFFCKLVGLMIHSNVRRTRDG